MLAVMALTPVPLSHNGLRGSGHAYCFAIRRSLRGRGQAVANRQNKQVSLMEPLFKALPAKVTSPQSIMGSLRFAQEASHRGNSWLVMYAVTH